MISISIIDIVGAIVTLFLALTFFFAIIRVYKKYFKKEESVKFNAADFSFIMIGSGYILVMLDAYLKIF